MPTLLLKRKKMKCDLMGDDAQRTKEITSKQGESSVASAAKAAAVRVAQVTFAPSTGKAPSFTHNPLPHTQTNSTIRDLAESMKMDVANEWTSDDDDDDDDDDEIFDVEAIRARKRQFVQPSYFGGLQDPSSKRLDTYAFHIPNKTIPPQQEIPVEKHSDSVACPNQPSKEMFHRQLVQIIYDIGVNHASPSVIIENMVMTNEAALSSHITSERVKSHLQKYRKNRQKSKEDFMKEYDLWMTKALKVVGGLTTAATTSLINCPSAIIHCVGSIRGQPNTKDNSDEKMKTLSREVMGGAMPAFLAYSIMLEEEHAKMHGRIESVHPADVNFHSSTQSKRQALSVASETVDTKRVVPHPQPPPVDADGVDAHTSSVHLPTPLEYIEYYSGTLIPLPELSEVEQLSSLGISLSHVVELFHSLSHTLIKERTINSSPPESVTGKVGASDGRPVLQQNQQVYEYQYL